MAPAFLLWEQAIIAELSRSLPVHPRLLEVGCATGALLDIIRELSPDVKTTGIDISDYAVWVATQKGHDAHSINVEEFKGKQKFDIIFSSETLEHLDEPRSFLGGIKNNLKEDGIFVFYVPSINRTKARRIGTEYVRFTNNLEHLLHFTPQFLQGATEEYFGMNVSIKEFDAGFGPYIVGAVSSNKKLLRTFSTLMDSILEEDASIKGDVRRVNTSVIALKFGKFKYAMKLKESLKKGVGDTTLLIDGLMGYHKGELVKSNIAFQRYLAKHPTSSVALKSLYANEHLLHKLYEGEFYNKVNELRMLESEGKKKSFTGTLKPKADRMRSVARRIINQINARYS